MGTTTSTNANAELLGQYKAKRQAKAGAVSVQERRAEKRTAELIQGRGNAGTKQNRKLLEAALDA